MCINYVSYFEKLPLIILQTIWRAHTLFLAKMITLALNFYLTSGIQKRFTQVVIPILFVQSLSCVQLFVIPWTAAHQASLSFTISWRFLKPMSTESVILPNVLFSVIPFSSHRNVLTCVKLYYRSRLLKKFKLLYPNLAFSMGALNRDPPGLNNKVSQF